MSDNEADLTLDLGERNDAAAATSVTIVAVGGEIDSSNCDRLQNLLSERAGAGSEVVEVDLANVTFIDSSGLRALLVGQQAIVSAQGSMRVVNPSDNVRRLFEITGLTERLGTS
jgi:anti-sigma B factor antagonist